MFFSTVTCTHVCDGGPLKERFWAVAFCLGLRVILVVSSAFQFLRTYLYTCLFTYLFLLNILNLGPLMNQNEITLTEAFPPVYPLMTYND